MKKTLFVIVVAVLQFGCAISNQVDAVQASIEQNEYVGLDEKSEYSVTLPSSHSGPYKSVDQLNFEIGKEGDKDKQASAILGKSRKTGRWETLIILVNENGEWVELPKSK